MERRFSGFNRIFRINFWTLISRIIIFPVWNLFRISILGFRISRIIREIREIRVLFFLPYLCPFAVPKNE